MAAMETVNNAGCVFSVFLSSSSGPLKQSCDKGKPNVSSAESNTALASADTSQSVFPMPAYCEPCPGNKKAVFGMNFQFIQAAPPRPGNLRRRTVILFN